MRIKQFLAVVLLGGGVFLASCSDDDEATPAAAAPTITGLEVGTGNSLKATIGSDLHMEAVIEAPGGISKIEVDLHPEDGSGDDIEAVFDGYSGLKNTTFHEHIDIPSTATEGEYHFHLKVTDMAGNQSEVDADVMVEAAASDGPMIENMEVGENNSKTGTRGDNLHVEAMITAANEIDVIEVHLHLEGGSDEFEEEFTEYAGQTSADFHKDIAIPANIAAGEYHMHLKVLDKSGNETELDAEVTID
jgi:hypothetical protein